MIFFIAVDIFHVKFGNQIVRAGIRALYGPEKDHLFWRMDEVISRHRYCP